jgi:hypothetical protein
MMSKVIFLFFSVTFFYCNIFSQDSTTSFQPISGKYVGFINLKGDMVIRDGKYIKILDKSENVLYTDSIHNYITSIHNDGLIHARNKDGWTYIYPSGEQPIHNRYKGIGIFVNDTALVMNSNDELFLINKKGDSISKLRQYPDTLNEIYPHYSFSHKKFIKKVFPKKDYFNLITYTYNQLVTSSTKTWEMHLGTYYGEAAEVYSYSVLDNGWIFIHEGGWEWEHAILRTTNITQSEAIALVMRLLGPIFKELEYLENEIKITGGEGIDVEHLYYIKTIDENIIEIKYYISS